MEFGVIKNPSGPIQLDDWNRVVSAHPALETVQPRTVINPFTNESLIAAPNADYYVEDGRKIGNLCLEDGEIKLTGIPTSICQEIAALFNADLHEDDRS